MKNLIYVVLLFSASCKRAQPKPISTDDHFQIQRTDSALAAAKKWETMLESTSKREDWYRKQYDSLLLSRQPVDNRLQYEKTIDSLRMANNKLGKELLHNKLIIQNAKYYLNIANKNPTQQKFLRGWMNRALNQ